MKNEFVPYGIALAMKELGFDEACIFYYAPDAITISKPTTGVCSSDRYGIIASPLYQQAFRWFREEHGLHNVPLGFTDNKGQVIYHIGKPTEEPYKKKDTYKTYEEAELDCLRKLIEIVNKNKEDE
jgi:hypothetical protein